VSHPSNDIAANIDIFFASTSVDNEEKQTKIDALSEAYKTLANSVVSNVCSCADREDALSALRSSYTFSVEALENEPANLNTSWPPPQS
jgi:hypothetical protein